MGSQISKSLKKGNQVVSRENSNNFIFPDFPEDTTRMDFRSAGLKYVPLQIFEFNQLNWLQLSQNDIISIPREIGKLSNLKTLRLFSNVIKSFPSEIGYLSNLTVLDAGKNQLSSLCPQICDCNSLTELNLQWNNIEELPLNIGNLKNLKILNLYINRISIIPESIGNLEKLETLDIAHNRISILPPVIGSLENLTSLNIVGNGLKEIPNEISKLKNLKKFDFRCNYVNEIPDSICCIPIRFFHGRNNMISSLPENFGNLKDLQDCRLDTNLLKTLPNSIGNLQSLKILLVYQNEIESIPSSLGNLSGLIEMDLSENNLSNLPHELSGLESLEILFLSKNNFIEIPSCISNMKSLVHFEIFHNNINTLSGESFLSLKKLGKLNLNLNSISYLPEEISLLENLVFLELAFNDIEEISENIYEMKSLTFLNLSHNKLKKLPESLCSMKQLKKLYISYNNFNFNDFNIFPDDYAKMESLNEFVCAGNNLNNFPKFLYQIPSLKYIDLSGNHIKNIESQIKNIENLTTLILSHNQIKEFPIEITELLLLSEIDISQNLLENLPDNFSKLELLTDIDLSGNNLKNIPDLSSLSHLLQLKIAHNFINNIPIVDSDCWISFEGNNTDSVFFEQKKYYDKFSKMYNRRKNYLINSIPKPESYDNSNNSLFSFSMSWSETRGRRPDQQDSIAIIKNIQDKNIHYLGLYDGHGGTISSEITGDILHTLFIERLSKLEKLSKEKIIPLFSESFWELNDYLKAKNINDGTAVNVIFLTPNLIYCANAGDSRSILVKDGGIAYPLSIDHKPEDDDERKRIEEAGGFVTESKRVNGVLALSRAIGDADLQPPITCEPNVTVTEITPEDKYLVMGCDGLWDVLDSDQVAQAIKDIPTASEAVTFLRDAAYTLGSTDNISVIVVEINHNI